MAGVNNSSNDELLNQILNKLNKLGKEIQELKLNQEKFLWDKSVEQSLSKVWNNKEDQEWSKLL